MEKFTEDRWDKEYIEGAHWEKEADRNSTIFAKNLKPNSKILDAGCGSGRNSLEFYSNSLDVIGIDISTVAITKAKKKSSNITFDVGRLEKLPYNEAYFDAFYCAYVLSCTDIEKSIKELARVTKSGGLGLIICLHNTKYLANSYYNNEIDLALFLSEIKTYFRVTSEKRDQYKEEDQHGIHFHERILLHLKRK